LTLPVGASDNFARLEQYNHMMIASGYDEEGGVDEKKTVSIPHKYAIDINGFCCVFSV